jgi:hypothetical protein
MMNARITAEKERYPQLVLPGERIADHAVNQRRGIDDFQTAFQEIIAVLLRKNAERRIQEGWRNNVEAFKIEMDITPGIEGILDRVINAPAVVVVAV